jgi:hypothetical protein
LGLKPPNFAGSPVFIGIFLVNAWGMRWLLTLAILASGFTAAAQSDWDPLPPRRIIFNPVVSTTARTLPQWQVGFQRTSGANINSNLLANSLSVGVFPRLELGVVPMFYATASGSSNFTSKLNFYKSDEVDGAIAFTETRFRSEVKTEGKVTERPDLVLHSAQIGLNYHPDGYDFTISPFLNQVTGYVDSTNTLTYVYSMETKTEWGMDVQWQMKDRQWLTFAYGFLRDAGLSPYENMNSGMGVAWSQFRPKEMFSRPSVGVYYSPNTGNVQYLISTTFYEL